MNQVLRQLARRMLTRHWGRSALIIVAIALPVGLSTCTASLINTSIVTAEEARSMAMGRAEERLSATRPTDIAGVIRGDNQALLDVSYHNILVRSASGKTVVAKGRSIDLTNSLTDGMFVVTSGAPSNALDSIALSEGLSEKLGVAVGDSVELDGGVGSKTVSATLAFPRMTKDVFFVSPTPLRLTGSSSSDTKGSTNWLVEHAVDREAAKSAGLVVTERRVIQPPSAAGGAGSKAFALAIGAGLLAEVTLLISAALAMIARNEMVTAGLLSAMGVPARGSWSFLARYVRSLSLLGAAIGAGAGLAVAKLLQRPLQERSQEDWGAFSPDWIVLALSVLMAVTCVTWVGEVYARKLRNSDVVNLLTGAHGQRHGARRRYALFGAFLFLAGTISVCSCWQFPYWAPLLGFVGSGTLAAGLVFVLIMDMFRRARRPVVGGRLAVAVAVRHMTASAPRALLAATSIAIVISVGTFVQTTSQMVVDSAERHRSTPVLEGWAGLKVRRDLTPPEVLDLGYQTISIAPVRVSATGSAPVAVRTDLTDCMTEKVIVRPDGGVDEAAIRACKSQSQARADMPSVAVVAPDDVPFLVNRTWGVGERRRFADGELAVLSGVTGRSGPAELTKRGQEKGRFTQERLAEIEAIQTQDMSGNWMLPTAYISRAAVHRLGLMEGDKWYLLKTTESEAIRRLLPADVQADARIDVNAASPYLAPAMALKPIVATATCITVMLIIALMMALWSNDLKISRQVLNGLGVRRRWMRGNAATLTAALTIPACLSGMSAGYLAAWALTASARLPMPWTWAPLGTGSTAVLAGLAVGAVSIPSGAAARRRG